MKPIPMPLRNDFEASSLQSRHCLECDDLSRLVAFVTESGPDRIDPLFRTGYTESTTFRIFEIQITIPAVNKSFGLGTNSEPRNE